MSPPRLPIAAARNPCVLDLAVSTGYAIGGFGRRPRFGSIRLSGVSTAERMAALRAFLEEQDEFEGLTAVVLEAAIVGDHRSMAAAEILTSLQAMAELVAYDLSIPVFRVASATARKQVLGTGRFPKGEAKAHVLAWARREGFDTASLDAADALCLWRAVEMSTLGLPPAAAPLNGLLERAG